eukprot:gnl/MRDRNA2_/MRDRNA2_57391_c0_seq1.p1 gnl/MRDRNA2_/MRDRNA2_57391_c0~~gnl/MRDRNA2_/MRDRNA2_57391_c0_seq1.p1  ORF type:complete len:993 (+),score=149.99 gnl/MRDRNA2_/MRDRNA2_57391_c0_seq1:410-2980(+)
MASFPWTWVLGSNVGGTRLIRVLRFARLTRLARVMKLSRSFKRLEELAELFYWGAFCVGVSKCFLTMVLICHYSACIWYLAGVSGLPPQCHQKAWACGDIQGDYWSWLRDIDWNDPAWKGAHPKLLMYTHSVYWSITTMTTVGYGDLHPLSKFEKMLGVWMLLLAIMAFSGCVGQITGLVAQTQASSKQYKIKMLELAQYMRWRHIPYDLHIRVRRYMQHRYEHESDLSHKEHQILSSVSPSLRVAVRAHLQDEHLQGTPFFSWFINHQAPCEWLLERLGNGFRGPGDILFSKAQADTQIHILVKGLVAVLERDPFVGLSDVQCSDESHRHTVFIPSGITPDQIHHQLLEHGLDEDIIDVLFSESLHDAFVAFTSRATRLRIMSAPLYVGQSNVKLVNKLPRTKALDLVSLNSHLRTVHNRAFSNRNLGVLTGVIKTAMKLHSLKPLASKRTSTCFALDNCTEITIAAKDIANLLHNFPFLWFDFDDWYEEQYGGASKPGTPSDVNSETGPEPRTPQGLHNAPAIPTAPASVLPVASRTRDNSHDFRKATADSSDLEVTQRTAIADIACAEQNKEALAALKLEMQTNLQVLRADVQNEIARAAADLSAALEDAARHVDGHDDQVVEDSTGACTRGPDFEDSTGSTSHTYSPHGTPCLPMEASIAKVKDYPPTLLESMTSQEDFRNEIRDIMRDEIQQFFQAEATQSTPVTPPSEVVQVDENMASLHDAMKEARGRVQEMIQKVQSTAETRQEPSKPIKSRRDKPSPARFASAPSQVGHQPLPARPVSAKPHPARRRSREVFISSQDGSAYEYDFYQSHPHMLAYETGDMEEMGGLPQSRYVMARGPPRAWHASFEP